MQPTGATVRDRRLWMWALIIGLASALAVSVDATGPQFLLAAGSPSAEPDPALGKRMYRQGLLPSGQPMRGTMQGDLPVAGMHCATCHRWSGFGASEGGTLVPPVTGPSLYQAGQSRRADLFRKLYQEDQSPRFWSRLRAPRMRPAYTDATLASALREGQDPTGRELDPLMPRYLLSEADMGHLIAYLKTLSATSAPGVDGSAIHFATVVTDGVDAAKRQAMRDVLDAYCRWKNADTQSLLQRPGHSLWHKDDFTSAYRQWVLHVWELRGPAETWPAQLATYYREQPVFALLSGIGVGEWRPVHEFCEWAEVPCLFPHTDLPVVSSSGAYALYFSPGLTVEAEALAHYLQAQAGSVETMRIVQVYRDEPSGLVLAQALQRAMQDYGKARVQDRMVARAQRLTPAFWQNLLQDARPAVLVLWLEDADVQTLLFVPDSTDNIQQLYLSASLLQVMPPSGLEGLRDKIYLTYPFALPQHTGPHVYRVRAWLRARGVKRTYERLQLNTYFALALADHALAHLVENFSRDYFIESIEYETENALNPGVFPHLSLGPGQRFASKGSYIVKLSAQAQDGLEAVSHWITP